MNNVLLAFGLTLFAGMATGIGSIIAFAAPRTNYRFLSVATGFSAGIMLYVSFVEIMIKGGLALASRYGEYWGAWVNTAAFFSGMLLIGIIDELVPGDTNPHETHSEKETAPLHNHSAPFPDFGNAARQAAVREDAQKPPIHPAHLMRTGIFTALAIAIHNFPEGLVTFFAVLQDPGVGLAITIAVALHNIPEGISVSVPIFYATGSRRKAFVYSLLSGLAEPLGAAVAFAAIMLFLGSGAGGIPLQVTGILFSSVAGIMVYISLDELLPTSRAYGKGHDSLIGLTAGMFVMALSLLLLK